MSKLITATAVLQLVEKGLITLDEDVRGKVPSLAKMPILKGFDDSGAPLLEENASLITLR
jgi:CubicO group peptidase (beta-lactamase class C family)